MAAILDFGQNLGRPKGAKLAPVGTFIQKPLGVQIANNLVEGCFLKVFRKYNGLHQDYFTKNL